MYSHDSEDGWRRWMFRSIDQFGYTHRHHKQDRPWRSVQRYYIERAMRVLRPIGRFLKKAWILNTIAGLVLLPIFFIFFNDEKMTAIYEEYPVVWYPLYLTLINALCMAMMVITNMALYCVFIGIRAVTRRLKGEK